MIDEASFLVLVIMGLMGAGAALAHHATRVFSLLSLVLRSRHTAISAGRSSSQGDRGVQPDPGEVSRVPYALGVAWVVVVLACGALNLALGTISVVAPNVVGTGVTLIALTITYGFLTMAPLGFVRRIETVVVVLNAVLIVVAIAANAAHLLFTGSVE